MQNPKSGDIYRHFKGDLVTVVAVATHTETLEAMVVYFHNNKLWVRPLSMFMEKVEKGNRFTKVGE